MELEIPGSGNGFGLGSLDVGTSKQKWSTRSEGLQQEGSGFLGGDAWRASKMARTEADFSTAANATVSSDAHMLRFSPGFKLGSSALPDFHHMEAAQYKNSGYYSCGGLDASTGMYLLSGVRGPFTPSQWLELEQQALIYRYITANEPIPVHLLIPIRKAFDSAGFYGLNAATTLKSTAAWGWGPFHLGYSNSSTDPEPGRCRRTDGKKWRCSRDAVATQKYCEKHMNRGRHRSRKHVEGQGTASGATKSSTTKPVPPAVLPGGGSSNNFDINPNMNTCLNRMIVNRENSGQTMQDATQLSFLSHGINLNCSGSSFSTSKHQICGQESALNGFGALSSSEHLLDPASQKGYGSYTHIPNDPEEAETRDSLFTFLDNWPNNNHCSADFRSSASSPANEKAANWKPVSWEASMGGPLAEALQGNSFRESSALSLLAKGCQLTSSSPTGVLQRSALVSLSNSSAGSSPRAGKTIESGG